MGIKLLNFVSDILVNSSDKIIFLSPSTTGPFILLDRNTKTLKNWNYGPQISWTLVKEVDKSEEVNNSNKE